MRKFLLAGYCFALTFCASAQSPGVKGIVTDTTEKKNLPHAVVVLLKQADSTLVSFTRTDEKGGFSLKSPAAGEYILLVSYPRFADWADKVSIPAGNLLDIGQLSLTPKSVLLDAVVIRSGNAIRIKGDTTEFVADSFKVKEGATVEDLLKKLPGLTVNSKGEITAQGKKVDKVLVDGEEFFGDDPTIATQNLGAKTVDRVQVYDTKSEQQQMSGVTTGAEGKTINIKLKEDAKKGAFGKVEAGTNFDNLTDAKLMLNRFMGKKKFSVFGSKSNTSTGNLNWEDRQKLGFENDAEYDEISGYYFSFNNDETFNDWSLRGLPDAWTAGALFGNKWNGDKNNLNGNYRYNRLNTTNETSISKQTLLEDTTYYNNSLSSARGFNQQHMVSGKYEWKPDSANTIKFTVSGTYKTTESFNATSSEALNEAKEFVNTSTRVNESDLTRTNLDNIISHKMMSLKKKNRQWMTTLRYGIISDDTKGSLTAVNNFYSGGVLDSIDLVDQVKNNKGESHTFGFKSTWLEPLSLKWTWMLEYSFNNNKSISGRNTFEKDVDGKYTIVNPVFSNHFDLDVNAHTGNTMFRYNVKKIRVAFGSGVSSVHLGLYDRDKQLQRDYHFLNFTPSAQFGVNMKQQSSFSVNYRGTTRQPTIDQLQPIRDNNDPLNVYLGNPALKVGFNHNVSFYINDYKVLSGRAIWINGGYNFTDRAISTISNIDSFGVRTYQPVNVNGNNNWYFYGNFEFSRKENKPYFGFNVESNGGKNVSFLNTKMNENRYTTFGFSFTLGIEKENKYSFQINPEFKRNLSKSSLRPDINNNYWTYGASVEGSLNLPWKLEVRSNVDFDFREKIAAFATNTNIINWSAYLEKKIFKKDAGKLILTARDILNQNKGFNRAINSNFISDERYQRLGQYFMIGFRWSFTQTPGAEK